MLQAVDKICIPEKFFFKDGFQTQPPPRSQQKGTPPKECSYQSIQAFYQGVALDCSPQSVLPSAPFGTGFKQFYPFGDKGKITVKQILPSVSRQSHSYPLFCAATLTMDNPSPVPDIFLLRDCSAT